MEKTLAFKIPQSSTLPELLVDSSQASSTGTLTFNSLSLS